ncbi:hypothetical protein P4L13_27000 [Bacillus anthracis]|uniref:hypothetical protein n=1 Tax=Bacillus anthracis TaxID=1392 RepID=UPI00016B6663|nr:hypothetical protein [Bacillus anthracis]MEB9530398.1 hypothetical protein [Bacillus anthracis]MEC0043972.1 hypothetical protein [Bacillus anthracis]
MKNTLFFTLLLSVFITLTACNSTNSFSTDEILGIGRSTVHNEVRFENTTDKKKIRTISKIFNKKIWIANKSFDPTGKDPDVVFIINKSDEGIPSLHVSIFYNEQGADVLNIRGEYTSLNKEEVAVIRKITV